MEINKHNYEAFFLDYHEGNLTPQQVAELLLFVEQHPELRDEFEGFENITLDTAPDSSYKDKEYLKKDLDINRLNYEEYFIRSVENDLNSAERNALNAFLEQHPLLLGELRLYSKTKLQPELSLTCPGKEELKRSAVSTDELLIASVEGILSPAEQLLLSDQLMADASMRHELSLYEKTRLQPDLSVVYPGKAALKERKDKVVAFYYYFAAAAAILLIAGLITLFKAGNDTIPAPEMAKKDVPAGNAPLKHSLPLPVNESAVAVQQKDLPRNIAKQDKKDLPVRIIDSAMNVQPAPQPEENMVAENNKPAPDVTPSLKEEQPSLNNSVASAKTEEKNTAKEEYLSLAQIAAERIKERTLDADAVAMQKKAGNFKRFSGWDVLQIMAKGVSRVTGKDVAVKPTYNDEGEVTAYAFNAGRLGFSRER